MTTYVRDAKMTDSAYIPPSDREFDIEDCYEIDAFGSECHGIKKLRASHAVADSIAADVASKAANYKKWADRYMAGQRIGRMDGKTIDSLCEARISLGVALARFDALHKEAGQ